MRLIMGDVVLQRGVVLFRKDDAVVSACKREF